MKIFYKSKHRIVLMVVMALLMQIVGPVVGDYVYGQGNEEAFKVDTLMNEDGTATVNWKYEYVPGGVMGDKLELDIALEKEQSGELVEDLEKLPIGNYKISEEGVLTLEIDETLVKEILEELEEKDEGPVEPEIIEPLIPMDEEDKEEDGKEDLDDTHDVEESNDKDEIPSTNEGEDLLGPETREPEAESNEVIENEDSTRRIDDFLGLFSKSLVYAEGNDNSEAIESYIFTGSFDVEDVMKEEIEFTLLGNIDDSVKLERVELTFYDEDDNLILDPGPYPPNAKVKMEIGYLIDDDVILDISKKYTMQLPKEISLQKDWEIDLEIEYKDENENTIKQKVGEANITKDGLITITFIEEINNFDTGRTVWVKATGKLNEEELGDGENHKIKFEFEGKTKEFDIKVKHEVLKQGISLKKNGRYNADNTVTWTIEVRAETNLKDSKVTNIIITDTLPEGQIYVNSFPEGIVEDGQKLIIKLSDMADGEKKTIKITTKTDLKAFKDAEEGSMLEFTNKASGTFGEKNRQIEEVQATVKTAVNYINKSNGIFEPGTEREGDRIKWTITLNNNNLKLNSSLTLKDDIPEGLELDLVKGIKISPEVSHEKATDGGFPIEFPNGLDKKLTITYYTKITDSDAYNPNKTSKYKNIATLVGAGDDRKDEGEGVIGKTIITKSKIGTGFDPSDHTISWKIVVNGSKMDITNPIVTDTLDPRLEYDSHTIVGANKENWRFEKTKSGGKDVLTFSYKEDKTDPTINTSYTINIKTKIKEGNQDIYGINGSTEFKNQATIKGTDIEKTSNEAKVNYVSEVIKKTNEGYDYTTRRAKWKIVVNQNKMEIKDAIVTDTIGDYHEFVEGELYLGETKIVEGSSESTKPYYTIDGKELKIYLGDISTTKKITFDTRIPEEKIGDVFGKENKPVVLKNGAIIEGHSIKDKGELSYDEIVVSNTIVGKEAIYEKGNDFIEWEVVINSNRIDLGDVTLEDKLNPNLILDVKTVRLYKLTYDSNGKYTIGDTEEDIDTIYTPIDGNKVEFTINDVKEAYILKFTTDIDGDSFNETITNKINLKGEKGDSFPSSTSIGIKFDYATGGATGSKTRGSITIDKVDEEEGFLSGVKFELLDKNKKSFDPKVRGITEEDGKVVFDDLRMGRYYIKEVEAPEGYILKEELEEVELKKGFISDKIDPKNPIVKIENKKIRGNIKFTKYGKYLDESETKLSGAEFILYDKDGKNIGAVSDENGVVEFKNIPYGDYIIKENKAPDGYLKSTKNIAVEIKEDDVTVELSGDDEEKLFNTRIDGDIQVKKFGEGENPPALEGAKFQLLQDDQVKYISTTSEDGTEIFKNVEYGTYTLKESKAPEGYN